MVHTVNMQTIPAYGANIRYRCRPAVPRRGQAPIDPLEEEVRQLRAAVAVYRAIIRKLEDRPGEGRTVVCSAEPTSSIQA